MRLGFKPMDFLIVAVGAAMIFGRIESRPPRVPADFVSPRPIRVGIVTWPGFAAGIVANGGFKDNRDSIFSKHKVAVEFVRQENLENGLKAFQKGGDAKDGLDMLWSTVDAFAAAAPRLRESHTDASVIMQVDWSRGADAIVSMDSTLSVEGLKGKAIALPSFSKDHMLPTPSEWLLEYALQYSSLEESERTDIRKNLKRRASSPDALAALKVEDESIPTAVLWEPDVTLAQKYGAKVIVSTGAAGKLIADIIVARTAYVEKHRLAVNRFRDAWFEGVRELSRDRSQAARVLMSVDPRFGEIGEEDMIRILDEVHFADEDDNARMFAEAGGECLFDRMFAEASALWLKRGYITSKADVSAVRNLEDLQTRFKPEKTDCTSGVVTTRTTVSFRGGQNSLTPETERLLGDQLSSIIRSYSNAHFCIDVPADRYSKDPKLQEDRGNAIKTYLAMHYLDHPFLTSVTRSDSNAGPLQDQVRLVVVPVTAK